MRCRTSIHFLDNGYTKEEMKMVNETRKILEDQTIGVTSTTVRIPAIGGHSEAVNVEFHSDFDLKAVREMLENTPGCCGTRRCEE
jgi:aspartate-semialdehyde dehydrogenase